MSQGIGVFPVDALPAPQSGQASGLMGPSACRPCRRALPPAHAAPHFHWSCRTIHSQRNGGQRAEPLARRGNSPVANTTQSWPVANTTQNPDRSGTERRTSGGRGSEDDILTTGDARRPDVAPACVGHCTGRDTAADYRGPLRGRFGRSTGADAGPLHRRRCGWDSSVRFRRSSAHGRSTMSSLPSTFPYFKQAERRSKGAPFGDSHLPWQTPR
jgi:hypothetical protein